MIQKLFKKVKHSDSYNLHEANNNIKTFGAKAKNSTQWAPDMTECPACGDIAFDSKTGKCTKCSYRESLKESNLNAHFKVGDVFTHSGLYGGTYTSKVKSIKGNIMSVITSWTSEDDGKTVSDTKTYKLTTDSQGNECIVLWDYHGEKGYAYPPSFKTASDVEPITESNQNKYELYNNFVIISSFSGDGYNIYSYDSHNQQLHLEDEGFGTLKDAKSAIDTWTKSKKENLTKESRTPQKGDRVQMDYYAKTNNGAKGTVRDKVGELYFIDWDDGTNSTEIKGFLKLLSESSYGGAFDIADNQFFTREDLDDFNSELVDCLAAQQDIIVDIVDSDITNNILSVTISYGFNDYTYSTKLDMRRISKRHGVLWNYVNEFARQLYKQIETGAESETITETVVEEKPTYNKEPLEKDLLALDGVDKLDWDLDNYFELPQVIVLVHREIENNIDLSDYYTKRSQLLKNVLSVFKKHNLELVDPIEDQGEWWYFVLEETEA